MKKLVKWCVCALLVAAAALTLVYRLVNQLPSADLPMNLQVLEIFEEGGCLSCHSADPDVPFYAKMPVAGKIVMKDIDSGYRAFDVEPFMEALAVDGEVNPVDLAKIEKVVLDDRMPMPKYYLVCSILYLKLFKSISKYVGLVISIKTSLHKKHKR